MKALILFGLLFLTACVTGTSYQAIPSGEIPSTTMEIASLNDLKTIAENDLECKEVAYNSLKQFGIRADKFVVDDPQIEATGCEKRIVYMMGESNSGWIKAE